MGGLFSNRAGGDFFCAGTLIAPRIFMTAGKQPSRVAPAIRLHPANRLLHTHAASHCHSVCQLPHLACTLLCPNPCLVPWQPASLFTCVCDAGLYPCRSALRG